MRLIAKVGIGSAILAMGCVGGFGIFVFRVVNAKVNPTVDYAGQIETLVTAAQVSHSSEPQRWRELSELLEEAQDINEQTWRAHDLGANAPDTAKRLDPSVLREGKPISDLAKEQVAAHQLLALMKEDEIFKKLKSVGQGGQYVRPLPKHLPLLEALLPELSMARGLARACAAQMRVAHLNGDYDSYLESFEGVCVLGQIFMSQGILIDRLVGIAIFSLGLEEFEQGLIEKPLPPEVLKQCVAILNRTGDVPSPTLAIESERRSIKDTIQWSFSDSGNGDGWFVPNSPLAGKYWITGTDGFQAKGLSLPLGQFSGLAMAGRKETTEKVDVLFDGFSKFVEAGRIARAKMAFQPDAELDRVPMKFAVLKILIPGISKFAVANDFFEMYLAGARQVMATELFAAEHGGAYPVAASEIVPKYLAILPIDPVTGAPFGYRVLTADEKDAYGRRYLVYSLGGDMKDDNGKQAATISGRMSAINSLNRPVRGIDFVINEPSDGKKKAIADAESKESK